MSGPVLWWWMGLANDQPYSNASGYILQVRKLVSSSDDDAYYSQVSFHSLFEIWKKSFKQKYVDTNSV